MIQRIIRAALSGSLLFMLLCAGAILVGQSNSAQPELFKYLTTCDGQPCYLGVVPGKTSWDDTVAIFEDAHIGFDPMTNFAFDPLGFRGSLFLLAAEQNPTVTDEIDLMIRPTNVTVASLIRQFGSPCALVVTPVPEFALIYPGMSLRIFGDQLDANQLLRLSTPIYEIKLFNRIQSCDQVAGSNFQHWHGFARYIS